MQHSVPHRVVFALIAVCLLTACRPPDDPARREEVVDVLHGVEVADPYRWLEDGASPEVATWTRGRNATFDAVTDPLPQRKWFEKRFRQLVDHDDESVPRLCLLSDRIITRGRKAHQEKWVWSLKEGPDGEARVILDANRWKKTESLYGFFPSPDCRLAAFGRSKAGKEDPVIQVMDLDTLEILPDSLLGWRQSGVAWLHDNSGFFYQTQPLPGEVPEGEHEYWFQVRFHALGTAAEEDRLVFHDPDVKESLHGVAVSEDGRWLTMDRFMFGPKTELWLDDLEDEGGPVPMATGMDSYYSATVVDDRVIITTDWQAINSRVMVTRVGQPGREHWQELIPESRDRLSSLHPVAGKLMAVYDSNAATRIAVYDLDGAYLRDVRLPTLGTAAVSGTWSKPEVWISFSSFAHPRAVYIYDPIANELTLYRQPLMDLDSADIVVEQVWYPSRDGTEISMFLVHRDGAPLDGSVPYLLTGYGAVDHSLTPRFSRRYAIWIEAGGGLAVANLRGGGEYGREWHEAGMLAQKQNTFDDFIAAADWLVDRRYTARDHLAIVGGSGGGLLVSAVITQRPDLCAAVLCLVPLTDMVRYHLMGLANIWTPEFGTAEDAGMFEYLHAYSPYHRLRPGMDYPAMLIVGSANDARTDPAHARKFAAAARWADADHGQEQPILLHIQAGAGHGYIGLPFKRRVDHISRHFGLLMDQVGLTAPES